MHRIIETFSDRTLEVETDSLFDTASSIHEFVHSLGTGRLKMVDQSFRTDGPTNMAKLIFSIHKSYDSRSKAIIDFSVFGEQDKLDKRKGLLLVRIKGKIETTLSPAEGVVSSAVDDYYLKNIYKILIHKAQDKYNYVVKAVKKEFSS